ncbi:peptidase family M28-domain-containing protein [Thelonectria olida]|uniref:Peptide hydrolase n=1 Tax=Thelonectria olida TaxID=1576542 RepID=A0A9P9AU87_9HYPO|nr:peptidase family M28-domain-containing protein [Thelonectria olida]
MPLSAILVSIFTLCLNHLALAVGSMTLTDDDLRNIPSPGNDFDITNGKLLAPILIPRVPGTAGQLVAQRHFVDFFSESLPDWTLEWQNITSKTPVTGDKDVPFSNIIFRRDPPGAKPGEVSRLTLVAHYDSKYEPHGFIGAIDSAAPCAMLMHVARSIDEALTAKWNEDDGLDEPKGLQILFLDGEEAFAHWNETDSLYGARALAEQWDNQFHGSMSTFRTPLDSISLFLLLDLLGSADPRVPSYFLTTHWAYRAMASIESRMRDLKVLETKPARPFLPESDKEPKRFGRTYVDDDHRPFMERGVDVLHIIPTPFPKVWHKMEDDGEHLDLPTVRDWARITTAFVVEWMDIQSYMPKLAASTKAKRAAEAKTTTSQRTEL